jgi:hypothetical protein
MMNLNTAFCAHGEVHYTGFVIRVSYQPHRRRLGKFEAPRFSFASLIVVAISYWVYFWIVGDFKKIDVTATFGKEV